MPSSIHVVIVNWNTGEHLDACLRSIECASTDDVRISKVTVVDNASSDGSADRVSSTVFTVEILRNAVNAGFAAACNQGARVSDADYLLFLNPDTRLRPETLSEVVRFMDAEGSSKVGICGALLLRPDGTGAISCSRFPTLRTFVCAMTGLTAVLPRFFPSHHLSPSETTSSRPVDQVIGAFFFVRSQLFILLEGFDERFFVYFEDVDFSLRARQLGFTTYFLREARVVHVENVSSTQVPAERLLYSLRSRLLYAHRHWPRRRAVFLAMLTLLVELPARLIAAVLRRDLVQARATVNGYRGLVGWMLGGMAPVTPRSPRVHES